MTAQELITKLQALVAEHGDLPVVTDMDNLVIDVEHNDDEGMMTAFVIGLDT